MLECVQRARIDTRIQRLVELAGRLNDSTLTFDHIDHGLGITREVVPTRSETRRARSRRIVVGGRLANELDDNVERTRSPRLVQPGDELGTSLQMRHSHLAGPTLGRWSWPAG